MASEMTACAITRDGGVFCWGANTNRWEFGASPTVMPSSLLPVKVPIPPLASFANGVGTHLCGINAESRAVCWGRGGFGQLGGATLGDSGNAATIVRSSVHWTDLWVGRLNTCGRSDTGLGLCWGANQQGEIGVAFISIDVNTMSPVEVDGAFRFKQIAPGWMHACGIVEDGRMFCWGANDRGQLGAATPGLEAQRTPLAVDSDLRFTQLALGARHTCALTTAGVAYCWGNNSTGQLGDRTTISRATPTAVATSLRFTQIATGSGFAGGTDVTLPSSVPGEVAHTCALTSAGTPYCWGWNGAGQLGDGTTITRLSPVPVIGSLTLDAIGLGGAYTCGMHDDTVWCWGSNLVGQLGSGRDPGSSSTAPVQVPTSFGGPMP